MLLDDSLEREDDPIDQIMGETGKSPIVFDPDVKLPSRGVREGIDGLKPWQRALFVQELFEFDRRGLEDDLGEKVMDVHDGIVRRFLC